MCPYIDRISHKLSKEFDSDFHWCTQLRKELVTYVFTESAQIVPTSRFGRRFQFINPEWILLNCKKPELLSLVRSHYVLQTCSNASQSHPISSAGSLQEENRPVPPWFTDSTKVFRQTWIGILSSGKRTFLAIVCFLQSQSLEAKSRPQSTSST